MSVALALIPDVRSPGQGSVTELPNGRFWARLPECWGRGSLGTYGTHAEAVGVLDAAIEQKLARDADASHDLSFRSFGVRVLNQREEDGVRGIGQERNRWDVHLADCALAGRHVADIRPLDIVDLIRALAQKKAQDKRGDRRISKKTVARCMAIVRSVFDEAIQRGIRPDNPCVGVKLKIKGGEDATKEKWAYLTKEEQDAVQGCAEIPLWADARSA
jgi:hypothetical protein